MQTVTLKPLQHRGMECIGIYFEISSSIRGALQKTGLAQFSMSNKCWYVPGILEKTEALQRRFFFPGQYKGEAYSNRSLQFVLAAARKKAGVLKQGSIHALRHSIATHLLDKGTDVTMIMKLLGHNDIKTTLRYLHVTNRDMLQVISPLDDLDLT